ncbi:hypothetical protein T07_11462 [Trichinella nelsoni]|uniref:Uncharacterized protein n=1 Tax=Trichinella nelsoni TaxID=6336 RepID=A0A0V0RMS7_9BILA|nr:hypothetical protein T07_2104 [Trichinella nelsoni]KRX16134.1 hypothetical protein T07_11462 [Trichinella nelsoni]
MLITDFLFFLELLFYSSSSSFLHSTVQCLIFFNKLSNFFFQFSSRLKIVAFAEAAIDKTTNRNRE